MTFRPNVLVIVADQLRVGYVGAWGNSDIRTPHMDEVSLMDCCCPFPACTPRCYSRLRGYDPHQHRGVSNHGTHAPSLATLPALLRDAG